MLHVASEKEHEPWGAIHTRSSAVGLVLATGNVGTNVTDLSPDLVCEEEGEEGEEGEEIERERR
jgi:hypothetical protein